MDDLRGGRWKKEKGAVVSLGGVCCVRMKSGKGEGGREGFVAVTAWVSCSRKLLAFDGVTQETYPIVFLIPSPCLKNVHKSYCSLHTIYLLYYARGIIAAALPERQQGEDPRFLHQSVRRGLSLSAISSTSVLIHLL